MELDDAPRIYRLASPLADYTELIGHWRGTVSYRSRALPRGAVTVIIDVGQRPGLAIGGVEVQLLDQPHVIAIKDERLVGEQPRCRRVTVGVDLSEDWPKVLQSKGFDSSSRTIWLIEGLLQYVDAPDVDRLFARVDALSARGSVLLYDIVGKSLLEAPFLASTLEFMEKLGAPWVFGSDTPTALVDGRGWAATATDMAEPGNQWKRWAHPAIPADVPGVPRGYYVEATKNRLPF